MLISNERHSVKISNKGDFTRDGLIPITISVSVPVSCGAAVVLRTKGNVIGHTMCVRGNAYSLTTGPL